MNTVIDHSKEIAETIIQQLGRKALFMLGAHTLIHGTFDNMPGLLFSIKGSKVKHITIVLNGADLYNMTFQDGRGKRETKEENVYAEDLKKTITKHTGLYTSL